MDARGHEQLTKRECRRHLLNTQMKACTICSFQYQSLSPSMSTCLPDRQSPLQPHLSVCEPRTPPPSSPSLSLSQPCSSSWCSSPKVSVVLRTQHVSICSNWPVSALCSSAHSPLNCLLFHLQRVFLLLATGRTRSLQGVYKDADTASRRTARGENTPVLM